MDGLRMRNLLAIVLLIFSCQVFAEESPYPGLQLAEAPIDRHDMESIKRGATYFATNCMSCHTLMYLKYDKVASDAGITLDKMPLNVKAWPFGVKPPDLSLEAQIRGTDWIYTYLHSFYQDSTRPTGANNLLVPHTAMPAILAPYQGDQVLVTTPPEFTTMTGSTQWYQWVVLTRQGTLQPGQYDSMVADITNFLAYAAEPYYGDQQRIGWWVLGFLVILFVMFKLLKNEYWKDVKKQKKNEDDRV